METGGSYMKAMICAAVVAAFCASTVGAAEQTLAGTISDGMCGAKHGMANMSDRDCTQMCASRGAQYVLVSDGKIYKLSNHAGDLKTHAGHTVTVTGEVKADSIKVSKVEMPASSK
jgi:hypothetical protein